MRPHFDGETYEPGRDHARLHRQLDMVQEFMSDRQWHTLGEIAKATSQPEASVSARIRDLRKPKFGGKTVERRYVSGGLWEYRLLD
jgi:hypothetical protein